MIARAVRRGLCCIAIALAVTACGGSTGPGKVDTTGPTPTIPPGPYTPGQSYFGKNNYVEYVAGNAPVIYSAPHGGSLTPSDIPDRTAASCGGSATTSTDLNTVDLVRAMQQRHFARYGTYPHIIINHLARRKLDANRIGVEAACGNAIAATALTEWHAFIDVAKTAVIQTSGRGWYMDMHGHDHTKQRLELGYLLSADSRMRHSTLLVRFRTRRACGPCQRCRPSRSPPCCEDRRALGRSTPRTVFRACQARAIRAPVRMTTSAEVTTPAVTPAGPKRAR